MPALSLWAMPSVRLRCSMSSGRSWAGARGSLRLLEEPYLYDRRTDDLYELNLKGLRALQLCQGDRRLSQVGLEPEFLKFCLDEGLLTVSPFSELDDPGVAALMRIAVDKARSVKPDIKLGICGEHGGDPVSIALCEDLGLDYVSCSPSRVPVARLAAAHAVLDRQAAASTSGGS